ncbi:glycosyltransferase family 2 protein [Vibrio campbellii]|uniref:glycosyltransferase family 2 protein n=1 Tax=Vibrio campbellii TaxID=680 RepID=UPI00168CDEB8|nr:glycosyltransferase family 2 protein [Vibrio campbellii]
MNNPLVTVIIPSYNHEQFISNAIMSVINQTYSNVELIVIDDGSKDRSKEIISELSKEYDFRFISRENRGLANTLNEGLELTSGAYFTTCSSDDFLHPEKIEKQVNHLLNNNLKVGYTGSYVIDDNNNIMQQRTRMYNDNLRGGSIFSDLMTFKFVPPVTFMYETSFFKESVGGYDPDIIAEDFDITVSLSRITDIGYIKDYLYSYRSPLAVGSARERNVAKVEVSESHLKTINKYKESDIFKDALLVWNFRRFIMFSGYSKTKLYAIRGAFFSRRKINTFLYLKALVRLVVFWKKYE